MQAETGTPDAEATTLLAAALDDPIPPVRWFATLTASPTVRVRVAQALARTTNPLGRNALHQLVDDEDKSVALIATAVANASPPCIRHS